MAKPLDKEKVSAITALYKEGRTPTEVAADLQVDKKTVYKYLKKSGALEVSDYDSATAAHRLSAKHKEKITELYKQGLPISEIQKKLHTSGDAIYREIRKQGLSRGVPENKTTEAIEMYLKEKLTVDEVLERTGISRATFFRRLKKYREG